MPSLSGDDRSWLSGSIKNTMQRQGSDYSGFADRFKGYGDDAYKYSTGIRDYATDKYKGLYDDIGGWGSGVQAPDMSGQYQPYLDRFNKVGETGATDPGQLDEMKGYGVFKNFATNGGFSDADKSNFRARALAGLPGQYSALRSNLDRRAHVQNGYGPGFDYAASQMARDNARNIRGQTLDTEATLADQIRGNQKWGASSGADAAQKIFGNQMQGTNSAVGLTDKIREMRNASAAAANSGRDNNLRNKMSILGELRGMRGETGAEIPYGQMELKGYGGFGESQGQGQQMFNNTQQKSSFWDKLGGVVGGLSGLAGAAGSVMTGLGGLKPKPKVGG